MQQRADPALARGSESALAKILAAGRNGATTSDAPPAIVAAASPSELVDPPQTAALRDAIRRQRKVDIRYEDAQCALSERTVWPIAIVYFDDARVFAAWCERRSAFRHFRIDRVRVLTITEERYPGRRQALMAQWRQQDRDWRSLLTVSDTPRGYGSDPAPAPRRPADRKRIVAMTNHDAWMLYAKYLSAWNTTSIEQRLAIADEVLSETVAYQTARHDLSTGRSLVIEDMSAFHEKFPGGHFEIGDVSAHHDVALLTWVIIQADGTEFARGGDQITVGSDGKIAKIITFAPSTTNPG